MTRKYSPEKQQELMESSLRNVRALVDRIEDEEAAERHARRRILAILAAAIMALVGLVSYLVVREPSGPQIILSPANPPPVKPAAPK